MDGKEVLREARRLLQERGWARGSFEDTEGHVCLLGAINLAVGTPNAVGGMIPPENFTGAHRAISALRTCIGGGIMWFNDHTAGSVDDVLEKIDCALERV